MDRIDISYLNYSFVCFKYCVYKAEPVHIYAPIIPKDANNTTKTSTRLSESMIIADPSRPSHSGRWNRGKPRSAHCHGDRDFGQVTRRRPPESRFTKRVPVVRPGILAASEPESVPPGRAAPARLPGSG